MRIGARNVGVKLGEDGTYLSTSVVTALAEKRNHTPTVVKTHRGEYGEQERDFVEVEADGIPYFADFITGSLYSKKTGLCLSSCRMSIVL